MSATPLNDTVSLLIELGCEEIPARMLPGGAADLAAAVVGLLDKAGLAHGAPQLFWTPRRLAVRVPATQAATPARTERLLGPPAAAAWDAAGAPTKALLGFAQKQGLEPSAFVRLETPKGVYAAADVARGGEPLGSVLAAGFAAAVGAISFAKTMRWGMGDHRFVRPLHWLVALADGAVLPLELFGVKAGRLSAGHRTLGPGMHEIAHADGWAGTLELFGVVADPERRRARLGEALVQQAAARGGRPVEDPELLAEVADIVEYPGALCGTFEERFVAGVPAEVLETCLRHHQKAFLVVDDRGPLPLFAVGINITGDPEGHVQRGHEWTVTSRLADALLFWELDRRQPLAARAAALEGVLFHKDLGTYAAKAQRVARLAVRLAARLGLGAADATALERAALLARCDLVSGLVGEFPELQGVAGGLLARADGEGDAVADAVYDLYRPSGPDDALPRTRFGRLLGLADRLDTLAGGFAVGLVPSGSKDPFALRRAGAGVVRLALEEATLDLGAALDDALAGYDGSAGPDLRARAAEAKGLLVGFLFERFGGIAEKDGARYDELAAVRALLGPQEPFLPADLAARLAALRGFRGSEDFLAVAAASKRVGNILAQAEGKGEAPAPGASRGALALPAEQALAAAVDASAARLAQATAEGRHRDALGDLAGLRPAVDRFFEDVLVMDPDPGVRAARLGLLAEVRALSRAVVDIAELVVEGR